MTESFFSFQKRAIAAKTARPTPTAVASDAKPLSVAELTSRIDAILRGGLPQNLLIKGEISNLNVHRGSGHIYFTLKDDRSCIGGVMFRSDAERLAVVPQDGDEVLVEGGVRVYAQRGLYQLYATKFTPLGRGALEARFRAMQLQLEREGLFAARRKRPIPRFPQLITLITSRQAAGLADMQKVFSYYPFLKLRLRHVAVQGGAAAPQIAEAIAKVRPSDCDLIILSRGGGSLEDLWAFNEEIVARAIVASRVPVMTGIGHDVDISIADLVADYHAHTPTEAAQVAVAGWKQAAVALTTAATRLRRSLTQQLAAARRQLFAVARHTFFRRPIDRVNRLREVIDDRQRQLRRALDAQSERSRQRLIKAQTRLTTQHPLARLQLSAVSVRSLDQQLRQQSVTWIDREKRTIDSFEKQLIALAPQRVLARGYSITSLKRGGAIVRASREVKEGDVIITRFADGSVESVAKDAKQGELF